MIGLYIDKQGFLHNIHLTQTSGFSLLDNAALIAIEKINDAPLSLGDNQSRDNNFYPVALQLPVTYRLTNS
jgi:outer membrane biosynthesis protein TonB